MSLKLSTKDSISHAQRRLYFRFCGTIGLCFAIIMVGVGLILVHQLDNEQKKLLNSIAAEYQRILNIHTDEKLRQIAIANPQQLLEHEISLLSLDEQSKVKQLSGSEYQPSVIELSQYRWSERHWTQLLESPSYLSLMLKGKQQNFWLVLNLQPQLTLLYQQWLWIAGALALLCIVIAAIVYQLIRSTLSPLHRLATVIDQTSDWSLDSLANLQQQQLSEPTADLDVLHQSTNHLLTRLISTINSMDNTVDAIAHDLRTPLTRIQLTTEAVLSSSLEGPAYQQQLQDALSDCAESAQQTSQMLTTLMGIHDEIIGKHSIKIEAIELDVLLKQVCSWYQEMAEENNIKISTEELSPCLITSDLGRLTQVLVNLIDNAFKYSTEGGHISLLCRKDKEGQVLIQIQDSGIGIASEHHQLIFKRLYRVDKSRSTAGYGLGLAQVKVMLDTLQGNISVTSQLSKGSCFTIILPNRSHS